MALNAPKDVPVRNHPFANTLQCSFIISSNTRIYSYRTYLLLLYVCVLAYIGDRLQHALHSIITGRMMLHLRRQVKDAIVIPSVSGTEVEGIQFARAPQTTQTVTEISTSIP